jgi:hypothetical protein
VGRSRQVPVLLDTGSVGLHIFAPAVSTSTGSGVRVSQEAQSITYSGGSVYTGVEAFAVITVGSRATTSAIPFALVQRASCTASKPGCPTADGMSEEIGTGEYGILGIGLTKPKTGLSSPLLAMPGPLGQTWSIHLRGVSGSLVLGARVPSTTRATTIHLRSEGRSTLGGAWDDARIILCFVVGPAHGCAPSLFDTGTFAMQLTGKLFAPAPIEAGSEEVLSGAQVSVAQSGTSPPFWKFVAGTSKSYDMVVIREGARSFVNCAVQAFFAFTIFYDDTYGTITLVADQ